MKFPDMSGSPHGMRGGVHALAAFAGTAGLAAGCDVCCAVWPDTPAAANETTVITTEIQTASAPVDAINRLLI